MRNEISKKVTNAQLAKKFRDLCNGRTILIVAGGWGALDLVEVLDPSGNNVWTQGMFLKFIFVKLCRMNIFQ